MRSGVSLGKLREIFARNLLAGGAASSSEKESGTHSETSASSREAASQAARVWFTAGRSGFAAGSDCAGDAATQPRNTRIRIEIRQAKITALTPRHYLGADGGRQRRSSERKIAHCRLPVYRPLWRLSLAHDKSAPPKLASKPLAGHLKSISKTAQKSGFEMACSTCNVCFCDAS